ncbi:hypothetical protein LPJ75_002685, partial [Coemansia sp. RSA 2598]
RLTTLTIARRLVALWHRRTTEAPTTTIRTVHRRQQTARSPSLRVTAGVGEARTS